MPFYMFFFILDYKLGGDLVTSGGRLNPDEMREFEKPTMGEMKRDMQKGCTEGACTAWIWQGVADLL